MRFSTMPDSEIISELCRRIKETRIQLGLSQIELAERAQVGAATIKRVELGESVTLSTLIGILRGLDRLHQLESILFDSHMRTFKAQLNAGPFPYPYSEKTHQPKEKLPAAAQTNEADATINEWYTSSASNSVVWSFTPSDGEKKANRLQMI
jgi:transcriptional regulator with XRE-family HTH domain